MAGVGMLTPLPLVLLTVLSTILLLATASDPDQCEGCPGQDNSTKFRHSARVSAGQIVVCKFGYWQTVCDDRDTSTYQFSNTDAGVACFQLGFTGGRRRLTPKETGCQPKDSPTFIAVDPNAPCKIWDEKLSDCLIPTNRQGFCTLKNTASVVCEETAQVKLVHHPNTTSYVGKVQHYYNTTWYTVCDGNWTSTMRNSHVLCQQLGLGQALDQWLHDPEADDTSFLHTHMSCHGTEDRLRLCDHDFFVHDTCDGRSVPWVLCSGPLADSFNSSTSYTSISLQWAVPHALQYYPVVEGYNITYREKEATSGSETKHETQPEVTIGGLKAGTQYHVTVMVVLKGDHPGPKTTLIISTTGPLVTGLAAGLGASGVFCVILVVVVGVIACRRRRPLPQRPQEVVPIPEEVPHPEVDPPPGGDPRHVGNPPPEGDQQGENNGHAMELHQNNPYVEDEVEPLIRRPLPVPPPLPPAAAGRYNCALF